MHLSAISVGNAVPNVDFDAVVHSVFQSAVNLRPANGNELLTLVASGEADLPQGLRVDTPEGFSFEISSAGEQVTCRDNCLRLNTLTMDLHRARHWKCDLPALKFDPTNPAVEFAWSFVWNALNKRERFSKSEIVAEEVFLPNETVPNGIPHGCMWDRENL